jgi:tryptophan-rich sensory protein
MTGSTPPRAPRRSNSHQTTQRWRWYHGLAFYLIAQVLTFGLQGLVTFARANGKKTFREALKFDRDFYTGQKQPKFAPPPWLFGPAWTVNNLSVIYGNLRVMNMPETTEGRDAYLKLQALSWLDYLIFTPSCFGLRSNVNGAVVTISMFGLTIASLFVSIFKLKDSRVALSLATLFIWLTLASALAATITLWNRDELYNVGPFVEPSPALTKVRTD